MATTSPAPPTGDERDAPAEAALPDATPSLNATPATAAPTPDIAAPADAWAAEWHAPGPPSRYGAILLGCALLTAATVLFIPFSPAWRNPPRGLATLATSAAGLALLLRVGVDVPLPRIWARIYARLRLPLLAVGLLLALAVVVGLAGLATLALRYPPADSYFSDALSLPAAEARLVLTGHNPYTSDGAAYYQALKDAPSAYGTPIHGHAFGASDDYPSPRAIAEAQRHYLAAPPGASDAFDPATLHSYPALSFVLYVPLLWLGIENILLLHLAVYAALYAWLVWLAPEGWRHWAALVGLAAFPAIIGSLVLNNEVISIALLLPAWHLRDRGVDARPSDARRGGNWHGVWSAILLGLACAYKQYCWFFVPFFAVDLIRAAGWRMAAKRGALVAVAFLLPNLPYILASPRAWLTSLWLPLTIPAFPEGVGIISLGTGHLLPYGPRALYALLEVAALVAALWLFARQRARLGDAALILALIPLWFAFRSTANYFAFAPWLALYAVNRLYAARVPAADRASPVLALAARLWAASRSLGAGAHLAR